jgi:hypothetical protein
MPVWKLDLNGAILGQDWSNVFFYILRDGSAQTFEPARAVTIEDAQDLATKFNTQVIPAYRALCTPDTIFETIVVENLYDGNDAYIFDLGAVPGQNSNPTTFSAGTALAFKMERMSQAGKPGQKRITGLHSSFFADGILAAGAPTTFAADMALALALQILGPADDIYAPCIIERIFVEVVDKPSSRYRKYRLPNTAAETTGDLVQAAIVSVYASTQKSRQQGV